MGTSTKGKELLGREVLSIAIDSRSGYMISMVICHIGGEVLSVEVSTDLLAY